MNRPEKQRGIGRCAAILGPLLLSATACAAPGEVPDDARRCPATPPEACTMEYRPVTGYNAAGEPLGEFANACVACTEKDVAHTVPADGD